MIFLFIDLIISYFTNSPTFFFLLNFVLIAKNNYPKLLIITLILDLLILNTYFLNTFILIILFLLYKKLKITKVSLFTYILSLSLIYIFYIISLGLINNYSLVFLLTFIFKNYLINLIFYILCYKILKKSILLSR